jgi:hypothetical protein
LPESRPDCELASETRHCHRTPGATLANAAEFAYDQVLIVAETPGAGQENSLLGQKEVTGAWNTGLWPAFGRGAAPHHIHPLTPIP